MLENFKHINSQGEVLDFLSLGIYANENELRDYEWSVTTENNLIAGFSRGVVNRTIPFMFYCNEDKAVEIKNQFYEHFDIDIITFKPGYFQINEYKFYCYITQNKKSNYLRSKRYLEIEIQVTSDRPSWVKEDIYSFFGNQVTNIKADSEKMYSYSYPYTYGRNLGSSELLLDTLGSNEFKLIVYGPVSNPSITIGENLYNVNIDLNVSEYLTIDSKEREIYVTDIYGNKENVFNKRNKENYIFSKINKGNQSVLWSGGFGFDIIIYDERSEPKWI